MKIKSDWHIHSRNSCDGACATVKDLVSGLRGAGVEAFGITDHVHTLDTLPDIEASRKEFLADRGDGVSYFGIEVSCISEWELEELAKGGHDHPTYGLRTGGPEAAPPAIALNDAIAAEYGIEYVVAGTHWGLFVPMEREALIRDYHRQNMFLATHPLVDIVAHPWWWMGFWMDDDGNYLTDPWLDDFGKVPASMHNEFANAALESGTLIEVNAEALLLNKHYPDTFRYQYVEYLAYLKEQGARFSFGSDCHSSTYNVDLDAVGVLLDSVGIVEEDFWNESPADYGKGEL